MTWAFSANFSNVRLRGSNYRRLRTEGYYAVRIHSTDETTTKAGSPRALLRLTVAEGDKKGCTETFGMNLYTGNDDDYILEYWLLLLLSLGVSEDKLQQDAVLDLRGDMVEGKTGYIHFTPAPDKDSYPQFKWITRDDYEFLCEEQAAAAPAETETEAKAAPVTPPEPGVAETPTPAPLPVKAAANSSDPLAFLEI